MSASPRGLRLGRFSIILEAFLFQGCSCGKLRFQQAQAPAGDELLFETEGDVRNSRCGFVGLVSSHTLVFPLGRERAAHGCYCSVSKRCVFFVCEFYDDER